MWRRCAVTPLTSGRAKGGALTRSASAPAKAAFLATFAARSELTSVTPKITRSR